MTCTHTSASHWNLGQALVLHCEEYVHQVQHVRELFQLFYVELQELCTSSTSALVLFARGCFDRALFALFP